MVYYCYECNQRVSVNATFQCTNCRSEFIEEIDEEDLLGGGATSNVDIDETDGADHSLNGGIFYVRNDGEGNNGRTVYFEGSNPFMRMMLPDSPFSRLFGQIFNQRYGTSTSSTPSSSNIGMHRTIYGRSNNNTGGDRNNQNSQRTATGMSSDHLMNFFNQLMSNLAEGSGAAPITRVAFHIDENGGGFQQLHGNLNDYAWGEGGIDHIVTQLLNQFESGHTESISVEDIANLPMAEDSEKQVENGTQCATCMETFTLKEPVAQLDCHHIFHKPCIEPWLKKHNTCPICRKIVDPKMWGPKITDADELD